MASNEVKEFRFVLIEPLTLSCIFMVVISTVLNVFFALPYETVGTDRSGMLPMVILAWVATILWSIFNLVNFNLNGNPRDVWKIGWVGAIGFVGFIPGLTPLFFGLFGFFVFFAFSKKG